MKQGESAVVKVARLAFTAFVVVLSSAVVAAWWAYQQFCRPDEDMIREQDSGPQPPDEPSLVWSMDQRRDG